MGNLDTILENISEYEGDIQTLVKLLRSNNINSYEDFRALLRTEGIPVRKAMLVEIEECYNGSEEDDWNDACALDTIESYRAYIQAYPEGNHLYEARDRIAAIEEGETANKAEEAWRNLDKDNIAALEGFCTSYPDSESVKEARRLISELKREQYLGVGIDALEVQMKAIQADKSNLTQELSICEKIESFIRTKKISVDDLINAIKKDHNFISSKVAKLLNDRGIITDFSSTEIDSNFISLMISPPEQKPFGAVKPITNISMVPCTEVYFWGIPSSGKTCALGAIMSTLQDGITVKSTRFMSECQGYGYMNRLSYIFQKGKIGILPPSTPTVNTYEMGMDVEDNKGNVHPITCIDLAGELTRCMFKNDAGDILTNDEAQVLQTVTDILKDNKTDNRKIHFFVIEYGAEDRLYDGLPQRTYLDAALNYIQRTGIFVKNTDALFLLITKVDKINARGERLQNELRSYIKENYLGFYNGLEKICRDYDINNGKVEIQPFSLGEVCMQDFCLFRNEYSAKVVQTIVNRSMGEGTGFFSKIKRSLRK